MVNISRAALFGKLNKLVYGAVESATVLCKLRGHPAVELTHLLHQILQLQDSDLHRILKQFACDPARVAEGLTESLERMPRGAPSVDLSSNVEEAVQQAWMYATLMFGESQVRSGHLVAGILQTRALKQSLLGISKEFEKIRLESLTDNFAQIVSGSPEGSLS
jgi:type VI secretion system protein VasG